MIIATAGHIDHGKTSLVKALSGVDTDRLPEEKKRGLSIDLGFAYTNNTDGPVLGFVDVPGHERFVRNMIAGVSGIDMALLVIAADDGIMPQTREHLAILDLLGVQTGAVALTKTDRIDADRVGAVTADIENLVAGTTLDGAPVFPVSSITGAGIDDLRKHLHNRATDIETERGSGAFRMTVDRAFIIEGAGIVATGLALSGKAQVNDRLIVSPAGIDVRVRSIRAQNTKAEAARAGERCALNIAAPRLSLAQIGRGDWLLDAGIDNPTDRFDARLQLLASEERALKHWTPVHAHMGAADIPARVAILDGKSIEPGASALVQIVLARQASALHGDRFVLRDQSATRTLGGGLVIDPFAPARGRSRPDRLALVASLERGNASAAFAAAMANAPEGLAFRDFVAARNLDADSGAGLVTACGAIISGDGDGAIAFSAERWPQALQQVAETVRAIQDANATAAGATVPSLARNLGRVIRREALPGLLDALVTAGTLEHAAGAYRIAGTQARLDAKDEALWKQVKPLLDGDDLRPPSVAEIAGTLARDARTVERFLQRAARLGLVTQVARNRFYLPHRLRQLGEIAETTAAAGPAGLLVVRQFRDTSGIGRNLTIEILEYFDRLGFTHRAGEHRKVLKSARDVVWSRTQQ